MQNMNLNKFQQNIIIIKQILTGQLQKAVIDRKTDIRYIGIFPWYTVYI